MKTTFLRATFGAFVTGLATTGVVLAQCAGCVAPQGAEEPRVETRANAQVKETEKTVYQFKQKSIAGEEVELSKYKGQVILIVNTASKCGFTRQYKGLEAVYQKYKDKGLVVLGFPANEFGGQEPGSDAEISEFCQKNFGVTFPLFSKSVVKGADKSPLFRYLTEEANPDLKGEISWNFEKFLLSRDGKLVGRYKSIVGPESGTLTAAIEAELAKK